MDSVWWSIVTFFHFHFFLFKCETKFHCHIVTLCLRVFIFFILFHFTLLCVEITTKSRVGHTTECNYQKIKKQNFVVSVVWLDLFLTFFFFESYIYKN